MQKKYFSTRNMARIAILGALGAVLMMFEIPLPVAPPFYKLDLSDLPCLIGAFAMGPVPALIIQVIKIVLRLIIKPTSTAFVGELAAFLFSSTLCVSAAYFYQLDRTKNGAMKAMIIASIIFVIVATVSNYTFIIPFYVNFYNLPLDVIIDMGKAIFPFIHDKFTFVISCVVLFNTIKVIIIDILTFVLYKHISPLLVER
ncbi:MAG: ECF transporter S component [Erysipelotrichaceae bacterium]|nr:ECF transporter S component [Erysipelotrichaceae bacterium]